MEIDFTTAIAAKKLGRGYIGIDIDPGYVKMSREKLEETVPTQINGCYVSVFLRKIVTIRDLDYKKMEPFLKTRVLRINTNKSKQLTIPTLSGKTLRDLTDTSRKLASYSCSNAEPSTSKLKQFQQKHLLETQKPYKRTKRS